VISDVEPTASKTPCHSLFFLAKEREKKMGNQVSRRAVLKGSALLAAASTLGFAGAFGFRAANADDDIPTIINVAATAEMFAVTHYYRALTSKTLTFSAGQKDYFLAALESEFIHLQYLQSNKAVPVVTKFFFPVGTFKDFKTLGAISGVAETVFVGAYIAATYRFAELNQPALAAVAAQVAVVEGQHLLFMRELAGEKVPNDIALAAPIFYNVSEAVPVVQPLLDGKKAAAGPLAIPFETSAFDYPGDDAVKKLIGTSLLDGTILGAKVEPWTSKQEPAAATMSATMSATTAE